MEVRRADSNDARAIAEVHVETWHGAYRGLIPDSTLDSLSVNARERMWQQIVAGHRPDVMVAGDASMLAGFCSYGPIRNQDPPDDELDAQRVAEIYAIYVRPAAWQSGVGAALMERSLSELRESGFEVAKLWVLASNARARQFYERVGFSPDGATRQHPLDGVLLDKVRYSRPLTTLLNR